MAEDQFKTFHPITEEEERMLAGQRGQACFFTGHRDIPGNQQQSLAELLVREVESLIYQGYTVFISGAARGFDLMAAAAVLQQKRYHSQIRLVLAIPCPGQSRGWPAEDAQLYDMICARGEVFLLSETYTRGCMQKRNRFLVDHAVTGVAYYNGETISGTGQTLRYAEKKHVPVINLAPLLHTPARGLTREPDAVDEDVLCADADFDAEDPIEES